MLPQYNVTDPGNGTPGNIVNGPFTGPLTIQEHQETFLPIDEDMELEDVTCATAAGASPAQGHQLQFCIGSPAAGGPSILGSQLLPSNQFRRPPRIRLYKGEIVYFRSAQLSGAIEAVTWTLLFKKPGSGPRIGPS